MRDSLPVVLNRKNSPALEVLLLPLSSLEPAVRAMVDFPSSETTYSWYSTTISPACLPISMFALLVSLSLVSLNSNTWFPSISTTETPPLSLTPALSSDSKFSSKITVYSSGSWAYTARGVGMQVIPMATASTAPAAFFIFVYRFTNTPPLLYFSR